MNISELDIEQSEKVLLPSNSKFDDERRQFIKRVDSCDVLAVPGSGKTTALQAKLYCMSRHLPLDSNQGILVLSHTNNAVDEIKCKLYAYCHTLFEAPNFIGTMQDFVDTFLAIPFYENVFKQKVNAIDENVYEQEVAYYLKTHFSSPICCLRHKNFAFEDVRLFRNSNNEIDICNCDIPFIRKWDKEGTKEYKYQEIRSYLRSMKTQILKNGILHYDDCYFLANCYLGKYPFIAKILRKRFKYVFVDETQDLKKYQLELLDNIFYTEECNIQRIGDKNQTIYKDPRKNEPEQWVTRNEITLQNSFRLTRTIAAVVNPFTEDKALDADGIPRFVVVGKRILPQGDIPTYFILFDEKSKDKLLPIFNEIIEQYKLRETQEGLKYGFHVIGWNTKQQKEPKKLRLIDIFSSYTSATLKGKNAYGTLSEFLIMGCRIGDMADCNSVITKILIHTLRLSGVKAKDKRYYTKAALKSYFTEIGESQINNYKLFLHKASILLYYKKYDECYNLLIHFISKTLCKEFQFDLSNQIVKDFIGEGFVKKNAFVSDRYSDISIGSAHSAKGQTHCATMYVETSYSGYESEHLFKVKSRATKKRNKIMFSNPLFQEDAEYSQNTSKSAMRMMYVGFSRPTHLLCYAVFKENWTEERIRRMENLNWVIIDLTN